MTDLPDWVPAQLQHAYTNAPAIRQLMEQASVTPDDIRSPEDLARIPVTSKDRLLELQHADPPFGGFLAVELSQLRHVFVSPGPLLPMPAPARLISRSPAARRALSRHWLCATSTAGTASSMP